MTQKFNTLADAIALAEFAHRNQVDKAGLPYIDHPRRVLEKVKAQGALPYVQMAAILHDVTEDTKFTPQMLLELGFPESAVNIVALLDRGISKKTWDAIWSFRDILEPEYLEDHDKGKLFGGHVNGVLTPDDYYYFAIKQHQGAVQVKLADIEDNLSPWRLSYLSEETQERLIKKYAKAKELLK